MGDPSRKDMYKTLAVPKPKATVLIESIVMHCSMAKTMLWRE